jgi:hypothetical protein
MMDYYLKYVNMDEEKLLDEIEMLNKKMFKVSSGPIRQQLLQMAQAAEAQYKEIQMKRRIKKEDTVLEIGNIESVETNTDYTKEELVNVTVQAYIGK